MTRSDAYRRAMIDAGLNLIGQAMSIYDSSLNLAACNSRFQDMFALPDHLIRSGASFSDTVRYMAQRGDYGALDDIEAYVQERLAQARTFEPHYVERQRANGQVLSIEGTPLPQGGWVTIYTDITHTKTIEGLFRARSEEMSDQIMRYTEQLMASNRQLAAANAALEETKRQLTRTEARTRLITEMMPAHIAHVDSDGYYTFSNGQLQVMCSPRTPQILGQHIADVLGPVAFAKITPHLEAAYSGASPVFEYADAQNNRRLRVAFTPDGAGGVNILSTDVTEETQTRVALQQGHKRDIAAQLTSGLAHDFSNLLTIVLGMQNRLSEMELPQEAQPLVNSTLKAAQRGTRLLDRMAEMTRHRALRPRATNMHALLAELKILATPSLPQGVGLSILDNTGEEALMLDSGRLEDALLNLILNARDACGSNGQITVAAHPIGRTWLEICVGDTGPGFSQQALRDALNPFFTTKGQEGSGLGLAMVYDMVKSAGGDIQIGNTVSGAMVTLRLPFRAAPRASGGIALLVEDSDALRARYRDQLRALGFAVAEATSVDDALTLVQTLENLSLILSDICLEGSKTGVDLCRALGADAPPVVLMTSLPPADPLHNKALAYAPVLQKPFEQSQLKSLLHPKALA